MLTENNIIELVCRYLEDDGYKINQSLKTTQRGIDIIAFKDGITWKIEAKGATSSKEKSNRYGKGFDKNQVKTHVSVALYAISKLITLDDDRNNNCYGLALPFDEKHKLIISEIKKVLELIGITIFWVKEDGEVIEQ